LYAYGDKKAEGKQMNKNFWGEPDDEPLPEWMDPKTYQKPKPKRSGPSLMESIEEAMKKPPVPVNIEEPKL
jgi:hypothetical protein